MKTIYIITLKLEEDIEFPKHQIFCFEHRKDVERFKRYWNKINPRMIIHINDYNMIQSYDEYETNVLPFQKR